MATELEVPEQIAEILSTSETINNFLKDLKENIVANRKLVSSLKSIKSEVALLERERNKRKPKVARTDPCRPSGLERPVSISDQLAKFIGIEPGTKISRIDAVRKIYAYIDANDLKVKGNGRQMILDADGGKLKSILNAEITKPVLDENNEPIEGETYNVLETDGLQIFNIQTLIKHHFIPDTQEDSSDEEPLTDASASTSASSSAQEEPTPEPEPADPVRTKKKKRRSAQ